MRIAVVATWMLVMALSPALVATAQALEELEKRTPEQIASDQTDFWKRTLGLSAEQAAALHQINLRYAASMSVAVKAPVSDAVKVSGLRMTEVQKSEELLELLTAPQRERYLEFIELNDRWAGETR